MTKWGERGGLYHGWYNGRMNDYLLEVIARLLIVFVAFPVHELAHAWLADYFGDDTPRVNGRLSFNPVAHIDIVGALVLMVYGFGWAKPVPVNEYKLSRTSKSAPMLVALAGPVSNLLLALLIAIPARFFLTAFPATLARIVLSFVGINIILLFFNLIPLFPLDGEKVLMGLLPYNGQARLAEMRRFGFFPLLIALFFLPWIGLDVIGWLIIGPSSWLMNLLFA